MKNKNCFHLKSIQAIACMVTLLFGMNMQLFAQGHSVSGKVVDDLNEPLPGASVQVKGTAQGVITDIDGNYTITGVSNNATLVFSFVGYSPKEVKVGNQTTINVTMKEDSEVLSEVVVVGYGTQKKVNLTGSVAAVKVDENLSSRSLSNVSSGLAGLVPGLQVSNTTSMAGKDEATLTIRGMTSTNSASPLVVVDGMPDVDMNRINFNDIESISVLKDAASASIYGSRAAAGVILITTKTGKGGKAQINFNGSVAITTPTRSYDFMDDYARALNMHQLAQSPSTLASAYNFKNGTIDEWLAMSMINTKAFPDTDVFSTFMRTGALQNYNVSASGGNDNSNYYISIGVMDNRGVQMNNDYTRYNIRANYDANIRKNLKVGVRMDGNWSDFAYSGRADGITNNDTSDSGGGDMQYAISGILPYDPETGRYGGAMAYGEDIQAYNPFCVFESTNPKQTRQIFNGNMYIDWTVVKGLVAHADYSLTYNNYFAKTCNTPTGFFYNFQTNTDIGRAQVADNVGVSDSNTTAYKTQLNLRLNYNTTIAEHHDLGLMFNYSEEYWHSRSMSASRNDRLHPSVTELDGCLTNIVTNSGSSYAEGLQSYVGRLNYTGYDKYLFEFNFRLDGSSKFSKGARWGFFPSAAIGWRFSEEDFVKKFTENWLDSGKLRVSYGATGNNAGVGRYDQAESLKTMNYITGVGGADVIKGFVNSKMINRSLSWETTRTLNIGLDLAFLSGRLKAEIDYYDRLTVDMLRPSDLSMHISGALDAPKKNIGELRNRGLELNLTWSDKINDFRYSVNFNGAYNQTRLEKWNEYLSRGYVFLNMPYHFVYAYQDLGMAQTWQDIYNATPQGASPGQVLFEDVNGDGIIDGKDQVASKTIQRDRPTTTFGITLMAAWKGFDLNMVFSGAAGRKDYWQTDFNKPSVSAQRYAFTWDHMYKSWSLENRDTDWQRLGSSYIQSGGTYRLYDMSYIRLKNIQLGYNFPKNWINKIGMQNARIYLSAENLFTATKYPGLDPDKKNSARDLYPINRSYSVGVNFGF